MEQVTLYRPINMIATYKNRKPPFQLIGYRGEVATPVVYFLNSNHSFLLARRTLKDLLTFFCLFP